MTTVAVVDAARRAPFRGVTALLSAIAVAIFAIPGAAPALELDRGHLIELWRICSCHFTHHDLNHLFWDTAMFAALGALIEKRSRRLLVGILCTSAVVIPVVIATLQPEVATYRGLSGIDSALFASALVLLIQRAHRDRSRTRLLLFAALATGFVAKIVFELATGDTLFVDSSAFTPLPLAHLVGAGVGVISTVPDHLRGAGR